MKVLVAEDDKISRHVLVHALEKWGYEVVAVADGNAAWEAMHTSDPPPLAILDWIMPGMDGIEVCRRLRADKQVPPIYTILLTSKAHKQDIVEGLYAGADDYIIKPFNRSELRARIGVGRRVWELQASLSEKEKLQGVVELAGAICHEMNQPLQAITGYLEIMELDFDDQATLTHGIQSIREQVERMGTITKKLAGITRYETKGYQATQIIDIEKASGGT